jgi:phosphoribosyl 1,2-cyclic phosphodiesterase
LSLDEPTQLLLRVNGRNGTWVGDFYQDTSKDVALHLDPYRRANTSVSLILRRGGETLLHVLVDVGFGALNSLLEFQYQSHVNRVDALMLTHPHFDHIAGLDWLAAIVRRSDVPGQPKPLPLYCTLPCYEEAIGRRFTWLKDLFSLRTINSGEPFRVEGNEGASIAVTPLGVWHGPTAPGSVIYSIEAGAQRRRVVLAWDMLHLLPDVDDTPVRDADLLLVDSTSWHPQYASDDATGMRHHNTWHRSVEEWLTQIPIWRPKRTYLIHYSGFSDSTAHTGCPNPEWAKITGVLSEMELRAQTKRESERLGIDLRVAQHAMLVPVDEPWP